MPSKRAQEAIVAVRMKVVSVGRLDGEYVMRWIDPATCRPAEKRTGTTIKRSAWQIAADKAMEVADGESHDAIEWAEFCHLYRSEHLTRRAAKTLEAWQGVEFWIDVYRRPKYLHELTDRYIAMLQVAMIDPTKRRPVPELREDAKPAEKRFVAAMKRLSGKSLAESSVAAYSTRLRAALNWAARRHLISKAPTIEVGAVRARGRPLCAEEFERMLQAAVSVRENDHRIWTSLLKGIYWSGLRLSEIWALSWDDDAQVRLDASGEFPLIWFSAGGQKGRRDDIQAVPDEFWQVVSDLQQPRSGYVFPLPPGKHGRMSVKRVSKVLAEIGEKAGVKVDPDTGKTASAHDLRRSFATVMEDRLTPTELQLTMRHRDFRTTQKHYLRKNAIDIAKRMRAQSAREKGGALGGATPESTDNEQVVKEQEETASD